MTSTEDLERLKTRIAWRYYVEGMTQKEIVTDIGLNRAKVLRLLAGSRQDGTVQVRVTARPGSCIELQERLMLKWGLEHARVIPDPQDPTRTSAILGAELGDYLSENCAAQSTIGLGWGHTLSSALPALEPKAPSGIRVFSLLGGLTRVSTVNPSEFAWRVADRLNAFCHLLTVPVFAPDCESKWALIDHPGITEIFLQASALDMAIVSVGALGSKSIFLDYGLLNRQEIASLQSAGAVGDLLCHFIDAQGEIIQHPVNERVLAVNPLTLRTARKIVMVSGGWHKLKVLRAAMRLLPPHVLIVNESVAQALLD